MTGTEHTVQLDPATHQKAEQVAAKVGVSIHQLLPLIIKNALVFAESIFADILGGGGNPPAGPAGARRH